MLRIVKIYGLLIAALVAFTGCEELLSDVDAPKIDPKIVVTSFISPEEELIQVTVSKTRAIYDQQGSSGIDDLLVRDAHVMIYSNTDSVQLIFNSQTLKYQISQTSFPITPGATYHLKVSAPGGYLAEATCTVPLQMAPILEVTSIDSTNEFGSSAFVINLRFKDIEGEENFYRVSMGTAYGYEWGDLLPTSFAKGEGMVSDKNKDGSYFTYSTYEIYATPGYSVTQYFAIDMTDYHYYQYHKTIDQNDDDNPFAEPSPIYSNIEGGLGIFAAYREWKFSITLNSQVQ